MRLYDSKINGIFPDQNDPFIRHKQLEMIEFPSRDGKMQRRLLSVKQTFAGLIAFTSTLPECRNSTPSGQSY
jgi:hypothetical protein